jgi:hypothetical protein
MLGRHSERSLMQVVEEGSVECRSDDADCLCSERYWECVYVEINRKITFARRKLLVAFDSTGEVTTA